MNGYLVDTNILSELTRPQPTPQVEAFLRRSTDKIFVSVFSIGEIHKGIEALPISNKRAELEYWLDNENIPWFGERVVPVTLAIAECWGKVSVRGRPRPVVDTVLCATALVHQLVVVTRNVKDYGDMGVTILNPWELGA